jgi:hypothetical protein
MSKEIELQYIKLELIQWLASLNDTKTTERLLSIRKESQDDFWDELTGDEKALIEKGIGQLDEGKRVSLDHFYRKVNGKT